MNYKKKTLLLIVIATMIRCVVACCVELGNDEVYYRMYAQDLQWNYFDHPPMVGWLIRATTANLMLDSEFFIRLGAVLSAAITTWLLFLCGKKLSDAYTGFVAAAIYTATLYGSIIAGTFILPDSPQMVCWAAALYLLIGITDNSNISPVKKRKLIWFGIIAGVGMLCKIHTSFLWLGFLLYILFYNPKWLKEPALYVAGIITVLFFYPVLHWNMDNHFVTWLYHSNRVNVADGGFDLNSFLTFTAGQVFYCNPVIYPFFILAIIATLKNRLPVLPSQKRLLLLCSLPLIIIATIISLFKNVLPHWTGPAYTGVILLTACYFAEKRKLTGITGKDLFPRPILIALALLTVITAAGVAGINFYPGTLGKKDKTHLGEGDFTLDMFGWSNLKPAFEQIVKKDKQSGLMKSDAVIICNKWFPAAHLDYYVAIPLKKDLVAIGDTSDLHQYAWLNSKRKALHPGDDAYTIVPSENYFAVKEVYASLFKTISAPIIVVQGRNGKTCRFFYVYKLNGYLKK